jgi:hypothetical protein
MFVYPQGKVLQAISFSLVCFEMDYKWKLKQEMILEQLIKITFQFFSVTPGNCESRGSSVSIVTHYGLDDRGSIPDRGRGFFF